MRAPPMHAPFRWACAGCGLGLGMLAGTGPVPVGVQGLFGGHLSRPGPS